MVGRITPLITYGTLYTDGAQARHFKMRHPEHVHKASTRSSHNKKQADICFILYHVDIILSITIKPLFIRIICLQTKQKQDFWVLFLFC
jgi:hypothetical protein